MATRMTKGTSASGRSGEGKWVTGHVATFLGLSEAEERYIELRLRVASALKARRLELGLTQKEAAERMGTRQPNVAKMELALPGVTVDRMIQALFDLEVTFEALAGVVGGVGAETEVANPVPSTIETEEDTAAPTNPVAGRMAKQTVPSSHAKEKTRKGTPSPNRMGVV